MTDRKGTADKVLEQQQQQKNKFLLIQEKQIPLNWLATDISHHSLTNN